MSWRASSWSGGPDPQRNASSMPYRAPPVTHPGALAPRAATHGRKACATATPGAPVRANLSMPERKPRR
jgi:hypothetical protein